MSLFHSIPPPLHEDNVEIKVVEKIKENVDTEEIKDIQLKKTQMETPRKETLRKKTQMETPKKETQLKKTQTERPRKETPRQKIPGDTWRYVKIPGDIWRYLETYKRYVEIPEDM